MTKLRRRNPLIQIILIALACLLGIGSRRYAHALPGFIAAYAGDTLWALAAFLGIGLVLPRQSTRTIALLAMAFSVAIELSQLYHAPWIDSIRQTTLGGLILGFGFLWSDLACYAAGVGLGVILERVAPGCSQFQEVVSVMSPILVALMLLASSRLASTRDASPFAQRGYYITFMRMPTYDLADWKKIVDGIHDDGGNTLLLWVAGAFRSKKYPDHLGSTTRTTKTSARTSCGT